MKHPYWIKSVREEGPFFDENGTAYARVTVTFRWWYLPIAWLHMRVREARMR